MWSKIIDWINKDEKPEQTICPLCGYYCLGKGGIYCIDKPTMVNRDKTNGE